MKARVSFTSHEWQPIETVPTDGTKVLLFGEDRMWVGWIEVEDDDGGVELKYEWVEITHPIPENPGIEASHWMPLPPPPSKD